MFIREYEGEYYGNCPTFVGFGDGDSYLVIEYQLEQAARTVYIHPQYSTNNTDSTLAEGNITRILKDYDGKYLGDYSDYEFFGAVTRSDNLTFDAKGKPHFEGQLQAPSHPDTFWPIRLKVSNYHNNTVGVSIDDVEYAVYQNASFRTNSTLYLTMMNQIREQNLEVPGTYVTGITVNRECWDPERAPLSSRLF